MKNSISEQSFYIDSEEEDEEKAYGNSEDGNASDSSKYSDDNDNDNAQRSKPNSYNTPWPQSYRQSIDLYSSVPSPSLNFLGTPTLSHLSSSFLSSSLTRRYTPEILPSLNEPLVPAAEDKKLPQQRRSSHSLLPPTLSRKPTGIKKVTPDEKASKVSHELPISRQSSYGKAVVNGNRCARISMFRRHWHKHTQG